MHDLTMIDETLAEHPALLVSRAGVVLAGASTLGSLFAMAGDRVTESTTVYVSADVAPSFVAPHALRGAEYVVRPGEHRTPDVVRPDKTPVSEAQAP